MSNLFDGLLPDQPIQVEVGFNTQEIVLIGVAITLAVFAGVWAGISLAK